MSFKKIGTFSFNKFVSAVYLSEHWCVEVLGQAMTGLKAGVVEFQRYREVDDQSVVLEEKHVYDETLKDKHIINKLPVTKRKGNSEQVATNIALDLTLRRYWKIEVLEYGDIWTSCISKISKSSDLTMDLCRNTECLNINLPYYEDYFYICLQG